MPEFDLFFCGRLDTSCGQDLPGGFLGGGPFHGSGHDRVQPQVTGRIPAGERLSSARRFQHRPGGGGLHHAGYAGDPGDIAPQPAASD